MSSRMDHKSFAEILKQSLKRYSESPDPTKATDGESFVGFEFLNLMHIKPQTTQVKAKSQFNSPSFPLRGYLKTITRKKPWPLSPEEERAFQLIRGYAPQLENPFWPQQLKRMKRQVFFRTHPDHGGSDELFRQVFAAFHVLEAVLHRHLHK